MKYTIEITKHLNKDYTVNIYDGLNYFSPVFSIKRPTRWNNCLNQIGQFLNNKKFVNIFQKKRLETEFMEDDTL
jgi:hypothetical protein